jgi:hypothetical protein
VANLPINQAGGIELTEFLSKETNPVWTAIHEANCCPVPNTPEQRE